MKKLYRSALFAGVLALGVAACGDDVTIVEPEPTPPPPLQVSMSPNQTINVGEVAVFAVTVSGGAEGAQASWTCSSSNTGVASVATSEAGCSATGVAAGNASITATVTKGNMSANAGAQVTVNPAAPDAVAATITIGSITKGGLGQPVDIDNVFGQIDASLNVNANDQTVTRVEVLVDGEVAAAQDLASGAFEWIQPEGEDIAANVQQLVLSFNTARYDVAGLSATPRYMNGQRQIQARIFVAEADNSAASNEITLRFNNADGFHVLSSFGDGTNQAMDADGRAWWGGPETELEVTPIPVMYSGGTISRMNVTIRRLSGDATSALAAVERCEMISRDIEGADDLVFEFSCREGTNRNNWAESNLMVPYITSVVAGNDGPSTGGSSVENYSGVLNLAASSDHPFPARIDARPPVRITGDVFVYRMISQAGLLNRNNWVNDQYSFSGYIGSSTTGANLAARTFNETNVFDGRIAGFDVTGFRVTDRDVVSTGVGLAAPQFLISTGISPANRPPQVPVNVVAGPSTSFTGADLAAARGDAAESVTNTAYRAWLMQADRLGNVSYFLQEDQPVHPARTFGYDETDPVAVWNDNEDEVGIFAERYSVVNTLSSDDQIRIRATDNASGFNLETAALHGIVSVRGAFEGDGAQVRTNVVGTTFNAQGLPIAPPGPTFERVRSDLPINNLVAGGLNTSFATQTALNLSAAVSGAMNQSSYYVYQVQLRDQAGNSVRDYRAVYVNAGARPTIESFSRPGSWGPNSAFGIQFLTDAVENMEASLAIAYDATGGRIVWERPTAAAPSVLRMNADIQDGVLFNDVIYRPNRNVELGLGLDAFGLPFIRNIIGTNAAGAPIAPGTNTAVGKPTSAVARAYSGFGIQDEDVGHSSFAAPPLGVSQLASISIPAEAVPNRATNWGPTGFGAVFAGGATFNIVRGSDAGVEDCSGYCVRALGPRSTFTQPFSGGAVLIAWADASEGGLDWRVLTVATPNFSGDFPTRDSGDPDDPQGRLFEWTFDASVPGVDADDLRLAAIGVRPNGDALLTAYSVEAAFNPRFSPAVSDAPRNTTTSSSIVHGPNSTGGAITNVSSCYFSDAAGALVDAPTGAFVQQFFGPACGIFAGGTTPTGTYFISKVVQDPEGNTATATWTVNVVPAPFAIDAGVDVSVETPATGTVSFNRGITVLSGGPVQALSCTVSPAGQGVTAQGITATFCRIGYSSTAASGDYTVTMTATDAAGQTASDTFVLTVQALTVAFDPVSTTAERTEIDWVGGTQIDVVATGSRTNADISTIACTPSVAWLDATTVGDGCLIEINDFDAAVAGNYTVAYQIVFNLGATNERTVNRTAQITVPEAPEFAPEFDIATTPESRREIERDRTANFVVTDGEGLGIDLVGSVATVSPSASGVTADIIQDVDGTFILQVAVGAAADTGNFTVTVSFQEENSSRTAEVLVYIRVIDVGAGEVPGQ